MPMVDEYVMLLSLNNIYHAKFFWDDVITLLGEMIRQIFDSVLPSTRYSYSVYKKNWQPSGDYTYLEYPHRQQKDAN